MIYHKSLYELTSVACEYILVEIVKVMIFFVDHSTDIGGSCLDVKSQCDGCSIDLHTKLARTGRFWHQLLHRAV